MLALRGYGVPDGDLICPEGKAPGTHLYAIPSAPREGPRSPGAISCPFPSQSGSLRR